MIIAVTGASGLIGSTLTPYLISKGHTVRKLVRKTPVSADEIFWDPNGDVDKKGLDGTDAIVHLAGENIAQRWNREVKRRILESRAKGTRLLSEAAASLSAPPKVFVCSSAIGYYGNRGDAVLKEDSGPGTGFLADVCVEWEKATEPASAKGIRVVNLRTGIVLDSRDGALARMLLPFKLGGGGPIGNGRQYWSWISMDDLIGAYSRALTDDSMQGGVNGTAPNPVTNAEFSSTLGRVLHRPAVIPMPAFAAKLALGEMAEALLLSSARVIPERLVQSGYQFQYPELEGALRHAIAKGN